MFQLSEQGQRTLLAIARESVRSYLSGEVPELPTLESVELLELRALFVSIHQGEASRGCVGNLNPNYPLYQTTSECAISAAVSDSRFNALTLPELPDVSFEVSVLSPVRQIQEIDEIEVGKHGLLVVKGQSRGLLLPQVAAQFGWDRKRFLAETCRKAGLRANDWSEAAVYTFTADVFGEQHDHRLASQSANS
jgi:AmmeMemoRadiSam system protein A